MRNKDLTADLLKYVQVGIEDLFMRTIGAPRH